MHVAEGLDHVGRRVGLFDFDTEHAHTGLVAVERALHPLAHFLFDRRTALARECLVQFGFGNRGAHRGLGHVVDRFHRIDEAELEVFQVGDVPAHDEAQIDEVLVARQDQLHLLVGSGNTFDPHALHVFDIDRFDREGQREIEARGHLAGVIAQRLYHGFLLRSDQVDACRKQAERDDARHCDREPALAAGALGHPETGTAGSAGAARAFGAAALEDVFDIGTATVAAAAWRQPRVLGALGLACLGLVLVATVSR